MVNPLFLVIHVFFFILICKPTAISELLPSSISKVEMKLLALITQPFKSGTGTGGGPGNKRFSEIPHHFEITDDPVVCLKKKKKIFYKIFF